MSIYTKNNMNFDKIREYLLTLKREDFEDGGRLLEAHTVREMQSMGTYKALKGEQIINYGEYFLVDVLGNDLTIVKLTKKAHKIPTGRVVHCKIIKTIIKDCRKTYGTPMNGYWVVPKL